MCFLEQILPVPNHSPDDVVVDIPRTADSKAGKISLPEKLEENSPYLVKRLFETDEKNLFNHVKFTLVKQEIDKQGIQRPAILDIGCGLQVAKRYLESLDLEFEYFGADYEPKFAPDAVLNLLSPDPEVNFKPDIVMMLDVLEHLHEDPVGLKKIVGRIKAMIPADCVAIITLPQMYRLDRFKLQHLVYPEHKIRLNQSEWREILETHFTIESVQGLGYLSVIPYLPMLSKRYKADNRLGSMFNRLRSEVFEWAPLKPADLWLSNTLGKLGLMKTLSNDILFVAKPKSP